MHIAQKTRDKKQILFCQPLTNVLPITCKFIVCRQQFFMMREVHAIFANIDIADIRGRVGHGDYCVNNISTTGADVNRWGFHIEGAATPTLAQCAVDHSALRPRRDQGTSIMKAVFTLLSLALVVFAAGLEDNGQVFGFDQALATRKIVTRRDASIEKINKIWAVHFRP